MLILAHTSFGYVQREVSLLDIYSLCIIFFILLYLYIACMITAFSEFSLCIFLMRSVGIRALRLPSTPRQLLQQPIKPLTEPRNCHFEYILIRLFPDWEQ